jgi:hypothetical protein
LLPQFAYPLHFDAQGDDMSSDPTDLNDLNDPKPAEHSDNEASKMPERDDEHRKQAPSDQPGKKPGEGEPDVG